MEYAIWIVIIVVAALIVRSVTRPFGAWLLKRDIAKRNAIGRVALPETKPYEAITRPTELYTVWDATDRRLTSEPLAYKYAHDVARMYAVEWRDTFPHQLPIRIVDKNGESVMVYDLERDQNII